MSTLRTHRECIVALIEAIDLKRITLVCQTLGGLILRDHSNGYAKPLFVAYRDEQGSLRLTPSVGLALAKARDQ